jgi:hypothetical protein
MYPCYFSADWGEHWQMPQKKVPDKQGNNRELNRIQICLAPKKN